MTEENENAEDNIVTILKDRAIEIFDRGSDVKEQMDELREWDSYEEIVDNVVTATKFLGYVAKSVMESAEDIIETVSNDDKLDAAIEVVKDKLDFPEWVEAAGGMFLKYAISAAYQLLVKKRII